MLPLFCPTDLQMGFTCTCVISLREKGSPSCAVYKGERPALAGGSAVSVSVFIGSTVLQALSSSGTVSYMDCHLQSYRDYHLRELSPTVLQRLSPAGTVTYRKCHLQALSSIRNRWIVTYKNCYLHELSPTRTYLCIRYITYYYLNI